MMLPQQLQVKCVFVFVRVCVFVCVVDLLFVRQLFFELLYYIRTRELVIIMAQAKHMNNKLKLEHELEL